MKQAFKLFLLFSTLFFVTCKDLDKPEPITPSDTKPTASFSVAGGGCVAPCDVTFTNTSTGTNANTKYEWDFGDGSIKETTKDAKHTFTKDGTFDIILKVTNGSQNDIKTEKVVIVLANAQPSSSFTVSGGGCIAPCDVTFTNTSTGTNANTKYEWNFGDGSTIETTKDAKHTFTKDGIFSVSLKVTNGSLSDIKSQSVAISKIISAPTLKTKEIGEAGINEEGTCIIQTADGGYFYVGTKDKSIIWGKLAQNGDVKWGDPYKESGDANITKPRCIQTTEGGYLVIGTVSSTQFGSRAIVIRLSPSGAIMDKFYPGDNGSTSQAINGLDIIKNSNNEYIALVGNMKDGGGQFNTALLKINLTSKSITNIFMTSGLALSGRLVQTSDGGYVFSTTDFALLAIAYRLIKCDGIGTQKFILNFGTNNNPCESITQLYSGEIVGVGKSSTGKPLVSLYNLGSGALINAVDVTKGLSNASYKSVVTNSDGTTTACGTADLFLENFQNDLSNENWFKDPSVYSANNAIANWVSKTSDGGYIVTGSIPNGASNNIIIVKTDKNGNQ